MNELLTLLWTLGIGVVLGAAFFGGLWWTVRRGAACRHPEILFLSSFLLRTGIALVGLYFVAGGHWDRLLTCLLGFVIARHIVTRLTVPPVFPRTSTVKENSHAS